MNKRRRDYLGPGNTTTYKLPVIKGEKGEAFYKWFNKADSLNGLITESLKLKFMLDQLKLVEQPRKKGCSSKILLNTDSENLKLHTLDINVIDDKDIDFEMLNTINSIKR